MVPVLSTLYWFAAHPRSLAGRSRSAVSMTIRGSSPGRSTARPRTAHRKTAHAARGPAAAAFIASATAHSVSRAGYRVRASLGSVRPHRRSCAPAWGNRGRLGRHGRHGLTGFRTSWAVPLGIAADVRQRDDRRHITAVVPQECRRDSRRVLFALGRESDQSLFVMWVGYRGGL